MNKLLRMEYKREGNKLIFTVTFDDIAEEPYCLHVAAKSIGASWTLR